MRLRPHREVTRSHDAMPALALLAGGLATRLGTVARHVPKSLVVVAGRPFVAHQLRALAEQGVTDVVICCGHLGAMIEDFVGDGGRFGCRVRYSHDGSVLLGTGGAIRKALPLLGEQFWVMYGDSYLRVDFSAVMAAFETSEKAALMTIHCNQDRWDASNVEFAGGRVVRYAKRGHDDCAGAMRHIDYGLGLYKAETFREWPAGAVFDLAAVQTELAARGEMAGYEVRERFYEIGSPAGLREADAFLRSQRAIASEILSGVNA
ncbi:MAG TPA: sugar phosphate nucleotidyltransferase [Acidobacteriaceae bacterium]|nr:sugar phosphate nucleotidyltransferase [Acidobacteriaceae bacterium]